MHAFIWLRWVPYAPAQLAGRSGADTQRHASAKTEVISGFALGNTIMQQVFVDFNSLATDEDGQVTINLDVPPNVGIVLHNGERVLLSDDELAVEGVVRREAETHLWLVRPDWTTRQERTIIVAPSVLRR